MLLRLCFLLIAGFAGRELEWLELLLQKPTWSPPQPDRELALRALARSVVVEGKPDRVGRLLDLAASQSGIHRWRQLALLDGFVAPYSTDAQGTTSAIPPAIALASEPKALLALAQDESPEVRQRVERVAQFLTWPGKSSAPDKETPRPLTEAEQARFEMGKTLYAPTCGACHQPHGNGQEGLAPPLAGSEWVLGSEQRMIRITLHGVRGPISVKGATYQLDMPPLNVLDDDQIAALLTYIRREWGNNANPVEPGTVAKIRAETEQRDEAWTEAELLKVP